MRNIPLFTTESGVASLILDQIWFNKTAYIRVQSSAALTEFLEECVGFCKAVGAERVFVSGENLNNLYDEFASIIRMKRPPIADRDVEAVLIPVSKENLEEFRQLYNQRMYDVPNASGLSIKAAEEVLRDGSGFFVYANNTMIGLGIAKGEWLSGVVSLKPGMGETVVYALSSVLCGDQIRVELIDSNIPAKKLYQRMGFEVYETISQWYKIFSLSSKNT